MTKAGAHMLRLLVAGGGTGGHLFPGVAVAEEFLARDQEARVLFVGTGRPVERDVLGRLGLPLETITARGLKGKSIMERLGALAVVPAGLFQSASIIRRFKPDMVLGVGGYSSGPVCLAARVMGVPTAIHEQNSVPGLTNRILGRIADLVFISFESARSYFPEHKAYLSGNPVRREIALAAAQERPAADNRPVLLAVGGSQGAHAVNVAVVEAVRLLHQAGLSFRVIHQTGVNDFDFVRETYGSLLPDAEVRPFIQDMGRAYRSSDLVVGRAGALTLAELAAMGRPAVFIPLPTAANNHQEMNALSFVEAGAAEMIRQADLTPELLAGRLKELLGDPERLQGMAHAALGLARPDAAAFICDTCRAMPGRKAGRGGKV